MYFIFYLFLYFTQSESRCFNKRMKLRYKKKKKKYNDELDGRSHPLVTLPICF